MRCLALALLFSATLPASAQIVPGLGGQIDTMEATPLPLPPQAGVLDEIQRNTEASLRRFDRFYTLNSGSPANVTLVPDPANGRRSVFHIQLHSTDPDSAGAKRTEVAPRYEYTPQGVRWYAASVYFPTDWVTEAEPGRPVAVFQLSSARGVFAGPPPLAIEASDGLLRLHTTTNHLLPTDGVVPTKANASVKSILLDKLQLGQWYCFVVRADWQYKLGSGSLQVWMNGEPVYSSTNLHSHYASTLGNFPKTGIYQPGTMYLASRHLYTDFIHVGAEASTMEEMLARTPCAG
ncbi:heparin lyase I family protein [Pseudoduganella sp. LjRoot289]|uniref:heparin lyase I family protein n=1 Tax=Pseudoduganella sp. LjRoot289 TaxID=3342314 RepID=UPI003ECF5EC0